MEVKRSRGLDRGLRLRQFPEWDAKGSGLAAAGVPSLAMGAFVAGAERETHQHLAPESSRTECIGSDS